MLWLLTLGHSLVPSRDVARYHGGLVSSVLLGRSSRSLCGNSTSEVNPCTRLTSLLVEGIDGDGDSPAGTCDLSKDKLPWFAL